MPSPVVRAAIAVLLVVLGLTSADPTPHFCGLPFAPELESTARSDRGVAAVAPDYDLPDAEAPRPDPPSSTLQQLALTPPASLGPIVLLVGALDGRPLRPLLLRHAITETSTPLRC